MAIFRWLAASMLFPLVLLAVSCGAPPSGPPTLVEVIDGDTIAVDVAGNTERIRLLGVDTPESVDPTRPVQCFGPEAALRLSEWLPVGTTLRLERDTEARDRFGRLLAYVYRSSDDLFINAALLREGFADLLVFEPNVARVGELEAALLDARTANRGLWGACGGPDVAIEPPPPTG